MATKRKTVDDPGLGSRKRRSVTEGVDDDRSLADNHSNGTKINAASSNDKPAVGHSGMNKHVVNLFTTKENLVHFLDTVNSANVEFMGVEGDAIPRQQQHPCGCHYRRCCFSAANAVALLYAYHK